MTYQALYRRWRPRKFAEIAGQEHVVRTLQNALLSGRITHAYLFCGSRGTGKTTTAKVLAKALNCQEGPAKEPCNNCNNCVAVDRGRSMDVVEIDAASNRGIDEIRELREKINFSPSGCRYRVYIIDEVHMLTNEAFNALLKTLEEPPAHVVFVLATTEPHRVPLTILSRCQRFDFRPLTEAEITRRLREVAEGSGLAAEEEALQHIARAAEGSLRDALSIMDQASSLGQGKITAGDVHAILGTVDAEVLEKLTGALAEGRVASALELIEQLVAAGKDLRILTRQLGAYWREVLVNSTAGDQLPAGRGFLLHAARLLVRYEQEMRWSSQPRLLVELFLFEAAGGGGGESVNDLALRLARLEEQVEKLQAGGQVAKTETAGSSTAGNVAAGEKEQTKRQVEERQPAVKQEKSEVKTAGGVSAAAKPEEKPAGASLAKVQKIWPQVLEAVKKRSKATYACLTPAWPQEVYDNTLVLGYEEDDITREIMEKENNRHHLSRVLNFFLGGSWEVRCTTGEKPAGKDGRETAEMDSRAVMDFFGAKEVGKMSLE